jgi:16S rRNA (uracil1498-N3)-methyltransferase
MQDCKEGKVRIRGGEVKHIRTVLRMKEGDSLRVVLKESNLTYLCKIKTIKEDLIVCSISDEILSNNELPCQITLYQALPKGDKMEWIIQKSVELGVARICPVQTKHCIVKIDAKKAPAKQERWHQIAQSAAQQSKRGLVPDVTPCMSFADAIQDAKRADYKWVAYEQESDMKKTKALLGELTQGGDIAIFIGPEGGFSEEEIRYAQEQGVTPLSLGKRILRTETAGLTLLAWIGYILET